MILFFAVLLLLLHLSGHVSASEIDLSLPRPVARSSGAPCHVDYKVYVYEISPSLLQPSEQARRNLSFHVCQKCIFEQFALEFVVMDYFTQFCGRTFDPEEADYFYLPLVRDLDYRISMATGKGKVSSPVENLLISVLEKQDFSQWREILNVTDKYWQRKNGSDHVIVMPAPVTNFRHQSNMRGFFHYMPQLAAPIFFNVEFSRSFVKEYPVCAKRKNLVMPYPTTDPELFSLRYFSPSSPSSPSDLLPPRHMTRSKLVFYHGGFHGSCMHIRSALNDLMRNEKKLAVVKGDRKREQGFSTASFCPVPVGDSPSSKRMYDALNFGCIPVLLSDDALWAYSHQSGGPLDPALFSITLPQRIVHRSPRELLDSLGVNESTTVTDHEEVNWGKPLPLGSSLISLLQELVQEGNEELLDQTILKKRTHQKFDSDASSLHHNTLVRLLMRIPPQEVRKLRENAYNVSHFYRFYSFNTSLSHSDPPLTATYTFPNGGATEMLDHFLSMRKKNGSDNVWSECQKELALPHNYVGRYPCEKRRRLRTGSAHEEQPDMDCIQSHSRALREEDSVRFWKALEEQQEHAVWNQVSR